MSCSLRVSIFMKADSLIMVFTWWSIRFTTPEYFALVGGCSCEELGLFTSYFLGLLGFLGFLQFREKWPKPSQLKHFTSRLVNPFLSFVDVCAGCFVVAFLEKSTAETLNFGLSYGLDFS